jgi:hypothetical protein
VKQIHALHNFESLCLSVFRHLHICRKHDLFYVVSRYHVTTDLNGDDIVLAASGIVVNDVNLIKKLLSEALCNI